MLYHYTTAAGLVGIATERCIWATHIRHLNDASEYKHAITLIREALEARRGVSGEHEQSLWWADTAVEMMENANIYVASFSERGNMLSQWRGYCPNGTGYSIGLSPDQLRQIYGGDRTMSFLRCVYRPRDHAQLAAAIADELSAMSINIRSNDLTQWFARNSETLFKIIRFAATIKDSAFREEREWRLVCAVDGVTHFRSGRFGLTPYVKCQLANGDDRVAISDLVVGPVAEEKVSLEAAVEFAKTKLNLPMPSANVRNCGIPLRTG